jgi:tetrahydromethanopterin S-methyltransferase subunit G
MYSEIMLTKKDLKHIGTVIDERLDKKLKPIKKTLKTIDKKLDTTVAVFDRDFNFHHRRLTQLEEKVGVKPPPFLAKVN